MQNEIKRKVPTNEQIRDYFGWKSICELKYNECPINIHTHEEAKLDPIIILDEYKCKCGFIPGEGSLKMLNQSWGPCLGSNEHVF